MKTVVGNTFPSTLNSYLLLHNPCISPFLPSFCLFPFLECDKRRNGRRHRAIRLGGPAPKPKNPLFLHHTRSEFLASGVQLFQNVAILVSRV